MRENTPNLIFCSLAFTLAEVLITLGIIGVVAALTIPTLVQEKAKQETVAGYKKAYSTLVQAVKLSEVDNGSIDSWTFPDTMSDNNQGLLFAQTYLVPYLRITKKCELTTGCFANMKTLYGTSIAPINVQYVLSDGSAIFIMNDGYSFAPANVGRIELFFDINGSKNPNIIGKDIFVFDIVPQAAAIYNAGNGDLLWNIKIGGVYPDGYGTNISGSSYTYRGCGSDVTGSTAGRSCGMKIVQDGYQIKSDYPW